MDVAKKKINRGEIMSILVNKINYSINDNKILEDVSLKVKSKQWVGIIGPNGSGKTSLLKHLYRALPLEEKSVILYEKSLEEYSHKESAQLVTVVKQENPTDFNFTVEEIVLLGRSPYRNFFENYKKEDIDIVKQALEQIGMTSYANRDFNNLSGGEKQRVLIARSLAQKADIFILDEPTNHLDVHYQWSLMECIYNLKSTVLGVFHELGLASNFCDYIYVLNHGKVVNQGTPIEVFTKELMADVFQVDTDIMYKENGKPQILINGAI